VAVQPITWIDLSIAASLVIVLAALNLRSAPNLSKDLLIAMVRLIVQLSLVAFVLEYIFSRVNLLLVGAIGLVMLLLAAREVNGRLGAKNSKRTSFLISLFSLFCSSFVATVFCLLVIIQNDPWYHPQYAIPLLGMMLGNTLNGVSLSLSRMQEIFVAERNIIENRLMLGETAWHASSMQRHSVLVTALIPMMNSMAAAGIVALPGMMTGQILAGVEPALAVRYQIVIFLLIAAGTGLGSYLATYISCKLMFDERERIKQGNL